MRVVVDDGERRVGRHEPGNGARQQDRRDAQQDHRERRQDGRREPPPRRDATVARLLACCLAAAALACREARRANPRPADAGTMVTVYVPPKAADRIAGRLQTIAAQHQWALSIRTDSAALADADLAIADS